MKDSIYSKFISVLKKSSMVDLDFEYPSIKQGKEILESLVSSKSIKSLTPFAMNGAGCLICLWKPDINLTDDGCPVVWIDSEGSPKNVFATNIKEALSLFPFGSGFIYDVTGAWDKYIEKATKSNVLNKILSKREIALRLKEAQVFEDDFLIINNFLNENNIEISKDPVSLVGNAIKCYPDFKKFI